jgi:exopolysaccharide biosynthesis polyprenyl glycosylphosphotransferase
MPFSLAGLRLSDHRLLLRAGDLTVAAISVLVALAGWSVTAEETFSAAFVRAQAAWFLAILPWMLLLLPSYHVSVVFSTKATAQIIGRTAIVGLAVYPIVYFIAPPQVLPRLVALYFVVTASAATLAWRFVYIRTFTRAENRSRVAIVGVGRAALTVSKLLKRVAHHMVVVGFVDQDRSAAAATTLHEVPVVSGPEGLQQIITEYGVSEIVLAAEGEMDGPLLRALVKCQEAGVEVVRMSTVYERLLRRIPINHLEADWVFTSLVDAMRFQEASRIAKRTVDILVGLVGSLIFLVALAILGPAIWLTAGRPILFRQLRIGRDNRPFQLIKFRTMVEDAERAGPQWAGVGDRRVTPLGRFLRRSRLDEIPQFLNVLAGDMSLVGPRPERPEFIAELEQTIPFYRTRLMVRPGLTGWAQVNYRYGDSVRDSAVKLEYDLYYIKHGSLLFDLLIAIRTVKTVLMFSGR